MSINIVLDCYYSQIYNMHDLNCIKRETSRLLDNSHAGRENHYFIEFINEQCIIINCFKRRDDRNYSSLGTILSFLSLILIYLLTLPNQIHANHEHLCLEDDYTNDLPIFIEKRTICNYDTVPVLVYPIKITPDTDYGTKLCLKG